MLADFLAVVPQSQSMVLLTYRPEYHGPLQHVAGAQILALASLSDAETSTLVAELVGRDPSVGEISAIIAGRAAGNPFFAQEIAHDMHAAYGWHMRAAAWATTPVREGERQRRAEAAIERLAAAPTDDGVAVRDIWLLRLRALLARARGDAAYAGFRDRYRDLARTLEFDGHIAWAEEMP